MSDLGETPGRPLSVLLIGNVANNAFYAARLLRRQGVEADVLCYDDVGAMSSPEWEEAEFDGPAINQTKADWWSTNLHGYERPRWFAQGPFGEAVAYLLAWRGGGDSLPEWKRLEESRKTAVRAPPAPRSMRRTILDLPVLGPGLLWAAARARYARYRMAGDPFLARCEALVGEFDQRFPDRPDPLRVWDLLPQRPRVEMLRPLLARYDVVQGFAIDPAFPMLAGVRPYTAFEHGTLRDSPESTWPYKGPFQDSPTARATALAYAGADWVFITNADCLTSARRLGVKKFTPMPHPYDESWVKVSEEDIRRLRAQYDDLPLFICPIRHDWGDKGTDRYLRALPVLRDRLSGNVRVLFTPWGREVERSRQLIAELGCNDIVSWVGPFGRVELVRLMTAADAVFDQLVFPSLSGVSSKALSCGTPVIGAYDYAGMEWMFPEPAPILQAKSTEEIVGHAMAALQPAFQEKYRREAKAWFQKWHSGERVASLFMEAYRKAMASVRSV